MLPGRENDEVVSCLLSIVLLFKYELFIICFCIVLFLFSYSIFISTRFLGFVRYHLKRLLTIN